MKEDTKQKCAYHCKCMNLDKSCPNPHYMDKNCDCPRPNKDTKSKCCGAEIGLQPIVFSHRKKEVCSKCGADFISEIENRFNERIEDLTYSLQMENKGNKSYQDCRKEATLILLQAEINKAIQGTLEEIEKELKKLKDFVDVNGVEDKQGWFKEEVLEIIKNKKN